MPHARLQIKGAAKSKYQQRFNAKKLIKSAEENHSKGSQKLRTRRTNLADRKSLILSQLKNDSSLWCGFQHTLFGVVQRRRALEIRSVNLETVTRFSRSAIKRQTAYTPYMWDGQIVSWLQWKSTVIWKQTAADGRLYFHYCFNTNIISSRRFSSRFSVDFFSTFTTSKRYRQSLLRLVSHAYCEVFQHIDNVRK